MWGYYFASHYYYLILVVPAMLLALWAQVRVKTTFHKYSGMRCARGFTGADTARAILDANGLHDIRVEHVSGNLTDHFDPSSRVIRLSDSVYNVATVAAVGVAAHEAGHAVQHAVGYLPIKIRSAIVGVTNIGSSLSMPLILLGLVFSFEPLVTIGLLLFSLISIFQLVTLPVEFNASSRALRILDSSQMLDEQELRGARKVLTAAALTYVAALVVALANLLRMILIYGRRSRRDD